MEPERIQKEELPQGEDTSICGTKCDREPVFVEFGRGDIEQSIPDRFEQQARRYPGKIAVKTPREALTYSQLNGLANRIARTILSKGSTSNEPVGLLFDHGTLLAAAILGTLKAGKIYLPLDPLGKEATNRGILADSTARLIVTDTARAAQAHTLVHRDSSVIDVNEVESETSPENVNLPVSPDSLAYIYYTSGSTGRPKGVADTHRNVLHNIMRYTNSLEITAGDRLSLLQPGHFSGSVSSLFGALLNGSTSLPYNIQQEAPGRLASWVRLERITIWHSVPTIFRLIATGANRYPSLRVIRLEGDQASPADLRLYKDNFPDSCVLVNGLGLTECGIVRQYFVDKNTPLPESVVPVGHAVEDMEVLILDEQSRGVGTGHIGEICVRSRYMAPGYWRKPELTEAAFRKEPGDETKRVYRTGDLGRMREDGCLEFLGRKDFHSKVRGRWVDIPAVEKALHEMGSFNEVAVITRKDPGFDTRLVGYVTPGENPGPGIDRVRRYLSEHVPDHMIPSAFVVMKQLPVNPFGKVDRHALPTPRENRSEMSEAYVEPRTPWQRRLVRTWEDVLNVRPVGIRDNFFDLGGDSLSAVLLFALIEREVVGQYLPAAAILEAPTVEELAELVGREGWSGTSRSLVPIRPDGVGTPFFCVHGHDGSVFCYRHLAYSLGPDRPVYGIQVPESSDAPAGARSFEEMASHYIEEIRTVQPRGPYSLGGSCMGGALSMEIAQQLQSRGEEVSLLAMIEAPHPQYPKYLPSSTPLRRTIFKAIDGFHGKADRFLDADGKTRLRMMKNTIRGVAENLRIGGEGLSLPVRTGLGMSTGPSPGYRRKVLGEAHREAYNNYRPEPYTGKVLLFVGKRSPLGTYPDPSLGWSEVITDGLVIITVPEGPRSIIAEPRVHDVAEEIKAHMEERQDPVHETH